MQRTRLNTLVDLTLFRAEQFFINPWRRISLLFIGFLLGFFIAQVITTSGGQKGSLDIVIATVVLGLTETVSFFVYRISSRRSENQGIRWPIYISLLNSFKLGFLYSMFLEALKLGS